MNISNYHHSQLAQDLATGKYKGSLYAYSIDKDEENGLFTLSINSTSLSELDEDEEGGLADYNYQTAEEAEEDLKAATAQYKIDFDQI